MIKRTLAIAKKEVKQLRRDKRLLIVTFLFPLLLLVLFGYAVNFDVEKIKLRIYDEDKSQLSREFIENLTSSKYFVIDDYIKSFKEIDNALDKGYAQIVLIIPNDFSNKINSLDESADVQFLIDGVDGNTAEIIKNYVESATLSFSGKLSKKFLVKHGKSYIAPIDVEARFWFNPDLETTKFLIPGLIAMILIISAVISVALSFVREKERGTIEQLNVSSLKTIELILGKTLPYIIIAFVNAIFVLIASAILFNLTVEGSYLLLVFTTVIFLIAAVSLGIFISVVSETQQIAFTLATFASLLPTIIFSGFIFPIEGMPYIIQIVTNITPAKFYLVALRAIILKGIGIPAFWEQIIYLMIFACFFFVLATIIDQKKKSV